MKRTAVMARGNVTDPRKPARKRVERRSLSNNWHRDPVVLITTRRGRKAARHRAAVLRLEALRRTVSSGLGNE